MANKTGNRLVIPLSLVQATRMIARGWKAAESLAREVSINCASPHIGAPKNMRAIFRQAQGTERELQMRTGIGIAVLVAIGLIWSVAVMSQWVPVASPEMKSAALIQPHEANRH